RLAGVLGPMLPGSRQEPGPAPRASARAPPGRGSLQARVVAGALDGRCASLRCCGRGLRSFAWGRGGRLPPPWTGARPASAGFERALVPNALLSLWAPREFAGLSGDLSPNSGV